HFQILADAMKQTLDGSEPKLKAIGAWHLPYLTDDDATQFIETGMSNNMGHVDLSRYKAKISTARCARVSYLTHDGVRDHAKDIELFELLGTGSGFGHWSPMEHPCVAATGDVRSGPYRGWIQYRKFFRKENIVG